MYYTLKYFSASHRKNLSGSLFNLAWKTRGNLLLEFCYIYIHSEVNQGSILTELLCLYILYNRRCIKERQYPEYWNSGAGGRGGDALTKGRGWKGSKHKGEGMERAPSST